MFLTPSVEEHSLWIFDHSTQKLLETLGMALFSTPQYGTMLQNWSKDVINGPTFVENVGHVPEQDVWVQKSY